MITDLPTDTPASRYLERVRAALGDLPREDRDDLLADLAGHLDELVAEGVSIEQRLGPPESYAADLRTAAGLGTPEPPARIGRIEQVRRWWPSSLPARLIRPYGHELLVGWWVVRAWMVVVGLGLVTSDTEHVVPPDIANSTVLGVLTLAAAVVASIHLGRRHPGRGRLLAERALTVAGIVGTVAAISATGSTEHSFYETPSAGPTSWDGRPLINVWAFDAAGNPIEDVYLYDQDGQPLRTLDIDDALPLADDGTAIDNVYPQRTWSMDTTGAYGVQQLRPPTVFVPQPSADGGYVAPSDGGPLATVPPLTTAPAGISGVPTPPTTAEATTGIPTTTSTPNQTTATTAATAPTTTQPATNGTATNDTVLVPALDPDLPPVAVPSP